MKISRHGERRIKERCNLQKKAHKGIVERAYTKGIIHTKFNGSFGKYITEMILHKTNDPTKYTIRIYMDKLWIYDKEIFITTYLVPVRFRKIVKDKLRKKKKGDTNVQNKVSS